MTRLRYGRGRVRQMSFEVAKQWTQHVESSGAGLSGDVADVAVDEMDRVYLLTRHPSGVFVFETGGAFVTSWGAADLSARPHGITVGLDGLVYCVDEDDHSVRKFTRSGRLVGVIGTSGHPSDTGADWSIPDFKARIGSIARGGPPFNHPTKLAVAPNGDLYVTDGYANARVHRFSSGGELLTSWGEPGSRPGQFHVPHSILVTPDEKVLVADRENDRIQVFALDGKFIEAWTDLRRPSAIAVDRDGFVYTSEMASPAGHDSWVHGRVLHPFPARISVFDARGRLQDRFAHGGHPCDPGNLLAPHGLAIDSSGSVYVAEITRTSLGSGSGGVDPSELGERHCHIVHKFIRMEGEQV